MILSNQYLKTLPPWMAAILKEKGATEIYDHEHDWNTPWNQTPDHRILRMGEHSFLVEVNTDGTVDLTGLIDGKVYTFYNCYLTNFRSELAEPIPEDEIETEIPYSFTVTNKEQPPRQGNIDLWTGKLVDQKYRVTIEDKSAIMQSPTGSTTCIKELSNKDFFDMWMRQTQED